jgi:transcriptional regulator with XRE-family HTH domain
LPNTLRPDQSVKLARLEKKRRRLGISLDELAARSGINRRTLTRIRRLERCKAADIRGLTFALRALEKEKQAEVETFSGFPSSLTAAAQVAFQGLLVAVKGQLPVEHERKVALYLLVTGANVPGATAGRVYGCTKQYVSKAMRQVEDLREDPEFGQVLRTLEVTLFPGGE